MSYIPNQQEFDSVSALSGPERYRYLLAKIADWEELWSVGDQDGWALMRGHEGNELVPIWPAEQFAVACCYDEWKEYLPRRISLSEWVDKWLPGMATDGRFVAAFPLPNDTGVIVSTETLLNDLSVFLEQYG